MSRVSVPAPALGPGQVGICVETYIRAARLGFLHLGLGDNRGPVANDPNATFRTQTLVTVDLRKQTVSQTSQAGLSEIIAKGFDPKRGSVNAKIDNISIDSKGDISFELSVSGLNGQKAAGGFVGALAPSGTIDAKFDFLVDPKGTVVLVGAEAKKYPSISVFSYSGSTTNDLFEQKESGDPGDLNKPMQRGNLNLGFSGMLGEEEWRQCSLGNRAACD